jgi:hypothetical protein
MNDVVPGARVVASNLFPMNCALAAQQHPNVKSYGSSPAGAMKGKAEYEQLYATE